MRPTLACVSLVLVAGLGASPRAQAPSGLPDLATAALASGPYSHMHMLLEKTILGIDVLTVDVRLGEQTRRQVEQIVSGASGPSPREQEIVAAVLDADQVLVTLEFKRNVSFNLWLRGVRDSLQRARDAQLIEPQTFRSVSEGLPAWFRAKAERGFATGDRIIYRGYPDRMHTLVVSAAGDVIVDRLDEGVTGRRAMLAGYFAPGTDFRKPLVASLLAR